MLIDAYLRQGNRAMARRQFERFVAELHRDLGVGPSPGLLELVADVVPSLRVSERDAGVTARRDAHARERARSR